MKQVIVLQAIKQQSVTINYITEYLTHVPMKGKCNLLFHVLCLVSLKIQGRCYVAMWQYVSSSHIANRTCYYNRRPFRISSNWFYAFRSRSRFRYGYHHALALKLRLFTLKWRGIESLEDPEHHGLFMDTSYFRNRISARKHK